MLIYYLIMCSWYNITAFLLLSTCQYVYSAAGDPVMFFPPFEVRTVKTDRPNAVVGNQQIQPDRNGIPLQISQHPTMQQAVLPERQIVHHQPVMNTDTSPSVISKPKLEKDNSIDNRNFTFAELLNALTDAEEKKEKHDVSRAAEYDYQQYPSYDYRPPPYGYQRPYSYGSYGYHDPSRMYMHPTSVHYSSQKPETPKLELKKDPSSLLTPTATKLANKVSGIITFVLTLLTGSSANNPEITGLKDLVVNGIVKPLFLAKGSLKVLLNKLTIPVISLLLINVEVFITIWWLWEDCPEATPPPYTPPKPEYGYK